MYYSALIGNPTEHSVSHLLYEELLKAADVDIVYKHLKIDVQEQNLKESLTALKGLNFCGISVTLPHKLSVMQYLDEFDSIVEYLGAVNTVKVGKTLRGYNTDWYGIVQAIKQQAPKVELENAVIFGTGGAARAAIYAVKQLGAKEIIVLYREEISDEKTTDLFQKAEGLGIKLLPYANVGEVVDEAQLVINATSAGMIGKDPLPFPIKELDGISLNNKIYFDAVFNPLETPLIKFFGSHGAVTVDGLWMMIYQGILALNIWLDKEIEITPERLEHVHRILEEELKNV